MHWELCYCTRIMQKENICVLGGGEREWGVDFLLIIPGLTTSCKRDQSYIFVSSLPSLDGMCLLGTGMEMQVFLNFLLLR